MSIYFRDGTLAGLNSAAASSPAKEEKGKSIPKKSGSAIIDDIPEMVRIAIQYIWR